MTTRGLHISKKSRHVAAGLEVSSVTGLLNTNQNLVGLAIRWYTCVKTRRYQTNFEREHSIMFYPESQVEALEIDRLPLKACCNSIGILTAC